MEHCKWRAPHFALVQLPEICTTRCESRCPPCTYWAKSTCVGLCHARSSVVLEVRLWMSTHDLCFPRSCKAQSGEGEKYTTKKRRNQRTQPMKGPSKSTMCFCIIYLGILKATIFRVMGHSRVFDLKTEFLEMRACRRIHMRTCPASSCLNCAPARRTCPAPSCLAPCCSRSSSPLQAGGLAAHANPL